MAEVAFGVTLEIEESLWRGTCGVDLRRASICLLRVGVNKLFFFSDSRNAPTSC